MLDVIDDEYFDIKTDCKDQIEKLESKLTKVKDKKKIDFPIILERALSNIVNLAKVYSIGDITLKRKIIGSIFPEKLEFFENYYRTTRANVLLSCIYQINNELKAKKTGKKVNYHLFPVLYPGPGSNRYS